MIIKGAHYPLSHPSSCMLVNHGPSQQSSKEDYKPRKWGVTARYYTSRTKTMLPTRKSVPRSSKQIGTTRRPPDHRKETQMAVEWSCLLFIRSGQNFLSRHSERGERARQAEEEVGRQHQEMDRPGVQQVPEGSGEQGKMEKTGGAPTTLSVKGLMIMMMMSSSACAQFCPDHISWFAQPFIIKLGMVLYYHEVKCHASKLICICYLQGQGHSKGLCN